MSNPDFLDSYAVPAPGVSITSGDLQIDAADVPLSDPFNGDCIELQVTKEIDLGQLAKEIQRRTKTFPQLVMRQSPTNAPASAAQPYILWAHPGTLNERACQEVLNKHVALPESSTEVTASEQVASPAASMVSPDLTKGQQSLVGKLQAGEQLDAAESSDLLRAILGITS